MLNNTYCIPAYFVYMLLLSPLLLANADLYWNLEARQVRIIGLISFIKIRGIQECVRVSMLHESCQ